MSAAISTISSTLHELTGALTARTRWTPDQLAGHQREQLDRLVRHAAAKSPYFRRVLGPAAERGGVRLHELPTMTKSTLMDHFDDIVTDDRVRREAVEAHLAGAEAGSADLLADAYHVFATAGTTGERGILLCSRTEFAVWIAAQLRMLAVMGVTADLHAVTIGAPGPAHLSRQMFAALTGARSGATPPLSVLTPMPELVAALNRVRPEVLGTYASTAALLAQEQLAGRLDIRPRIVSTAAEILTEEMRQRIRQAWGVEPHQAYVASEVPLLASTSNKHVGMHLWEDLVLVEIVDTHDQPVAPGVPGHKVLITNLVNLTQPLIRYELSDSVTLAQDHDPTGWPFRRLASVDGRSDDIITLPAGQAGGVVAVHPVRLRSAFIAFREVEQYQISYGKDGLTVRTVLAPGAAGDTAERVRDALAHTLRDAGAVPPPVAVIPVAHLTRDNGPAGKFKLIRTTTPPAGQEGP